MPFPAGTPDILKAAYGAIERATYARADTRQIWSAVRNALGGSTFGIGFQGAQYVSRLRGIAAGMRNAEEKLAASAAGIGINHEHIGTPPWAREPAIRAAAPSYAVRFQALSTNPAFLEGVPGEPEFQAAWLTLKFSQLPATVGELRDMIAAHVADASLTRRTATGTPTGPVQDIGRIQLLAI